MRGETNASVRKRHGDGIGNNTDKVIHSPLRYVGGKGWLFRQLQEYIPEGTTEVISPFLGGGAIELNLALRGVRVYGYDVCPYLLNFWRYWLKSPGSIERHAKLVLAITTRDALKTIKTDFDFTGFHGAALYYVCNRVSFGGQSLKNAHIKAYETVNGRFAYPLYRTQTRRRYVFPHSAFWQNFPSVPLTVGQADFKESLGRHPNILAYLDPPYFGHEHFYGLAAFDHLGLSELLKGRENWILSYNNHPFVREVYKDYARVTTKSRNFKTGKKTASEVIIFSHGIAERLEYKQQYLF